MRWQCFRCITNADVILIHCNQCYVWLMATTLSPIELLQLQLAFPMEARWIRLVSWPVGWSARYTPALWSIPGLCAAFSYTSPVSALTAFIAADDLEVFCKPQHIHARTSLVLLSDVPNVIARIPSPGAVHAFRLLCAEGSLRRSGYCRDWRRWSNRWRYAPGRAEQQDSDEKEWNHCWTSAVCCSRRLLFKDSTTGRKCRFDGSNVRRPSLLWGELKPNLLANADLSCVLWQSCVVWLCQRWEKVSYARIL